MLKLQCKVSTWRHVLLHCTIPQPLLPRISKAVRCRVNCAVQRPRQDSRGQLAVRELSDAWRQCWRIPQHKWATFTGRALQQHRTRAVCSVPSPSERVQQFFFAHVTTSKSLTSNAEHLGVVQCHYFIRQLSVNSSCRLVSRHNVFCRSPTRASGSERPIRQPLAQRKRRADDCAVPQRIYWMTVSSPSCWQHR